jgi:hypothetical protein
MVNIHCMGKVSLFNTLRVGVARKDEELPKGYQTGCGSDYKHSSDSMG